MSKKSFKTLLNSRKGRDFLIYCPGKNIKEWHRRVSLFADEEDLLIIGSNRIVDLTRLDYHLFTNNDKYEAYGHLIAESSTLLLGSHIGEQHIKKHQPKEYVSVNYTDRDPKESMRYDKKKDVVYGYYRTSGNLAIMLCHLVGARKIYVAGMSGFTFNFDGTVHYYKAEIKRDRKTKKEWSRKYDKPVAKSLDDLKEYGIDFTLITPTIYGKHYDHRVLDRYGL